MKKDKDKKYTKEEKIGAFDKLPLTENENGVPHAHEPESLIPDYEACIKEDSWTTKETAALVVGITVHGLKRLRDKGPSTSRIPEDDQEWVMEAYERYLIIHKKIEKALAAEKLNAEDVYGEYYVIPNEAVKWAIEEEDIEIPKELLAAYSESELKKPQSCVFQKPPACDTKKAKMKHVKEVALSSAVKLLTKNPNTKPKDLMKDFEVTEAVEKCNFAEGEEPKLKTYQGWMTWLYQNSEFEPTLGCPKKKKQK